MRAKCFFQFREEIKQEDEAARLKRQEQEGYKSSTGYGGKFGVMEDRQDKSAVGWDHAEKAAKHESQKGKGLLILSSLLSACFDFITNALTYTIFSL